MFHNWPWYHVNTGCVFVLTSMLICFQHVFKTGYFKINEPFKKVCILSATDSQSAKNNLQILENIYLLSHAFLPGIIMINHAVYY